MGKTSFVVRNRKILVPIAMMIARRVARKKARKATNFVLKLLLALTIVGGIAVLAWWWLNRSDGGDDWRGWEPAPGPVAPAPVPEPVLA